MENFNLMKESIIKKDYNIILIGFMGTGKTTVAECLSEMLQKKRVDTDNLIVKSEGMSINDIFKKYGEEYFRNCESRILAEIRSQNGLIVSCGGGAVLRDENIQLLKMNGKVVLLTAAPETIYKRLEKNKDRPLLSNNTNAEFIAGLMEKRTDKYVKAADIVINTDSKTVLEICDELIVKLAALD